MKKLIFSLSALAALLLAGSCQRENLEPVEQGGTVTYTVQVPGALATKAAGDYELIYEVYREAQVGTDADPIYEGKQTFSGNSVDLPLEFVKGQNFVVLFWAQKVGVTAYSTGNLRNVTLNTDLTANQENYEVFAGMDEVSNCVSSNNGDVKLVRPIAQLNIATDAEGLKLGDTDVTLTSSFVTVKGLSTTYNVYNKAVSETLSDVEFGVAGVPDGKLGTTDYTYVAMNYIGFIDKEGTTVDVDFTVKTSEGDIAHSVSSVPVKPNFKTNIIGNLITATDNYQVTLGAWGTEETNVEVVAVSTAQDLQEAIENIQPGAEGNIILEGDINLGALFGASTLSVTKAGNAQLPIVIDAEKAMTLDLNGFTITTPWEDETAGKHYYAFDNKGTLNIVDSKANGKIVARGIFNYGKMTLESGTIEACDGNGGYGVRNYEGAEFVMNGGTVATIYDDGDIPGEGYDASPIRVDQGAKAEIKGGIINNVSNFTVAIDNYGETIVDDGTFTSVHTTLANSAVMTINGGSFTCNGIEGITAHALWAAAGTTTINGGTFDGKDNYNGFNVDADKGAVVDIKGGKFLPVHSGSLYGEGTINVTGGEFFDDPSARLVNGYEAVQGEYGYYTIQYLPEAKIGETIYSTLTEAFNVGGNIELLHDVTLSNSIVVDDDKNITLDLGNHTITGPDAARDSEGNRIHVLINNGILSIQNGTINSIAINGGSAILNKGTLTLNNVNVNGAPTDTATGTASYAVNTEGAGSKLTVNNSNISGRGAIGATEGTKVELNGGTYHTPAVAWGHAVYATNEGTEVVINDGIFSEGYEMAANNWGMYQIYSGDKAKVTVKGGTFMPWDCANGYDLHTATDGTIEIYGGTFAENPSSQNKKNYVAYGYKVVENADGTYTVQKMNPVAEADGVPYESLQEAFTVGGNITLLCDVTVDETVVLADAMTAVLDLNGKTITGTMHKSVGAVVKNNGALTIKNGTISSTAANGGSAVANNGTLVVEKATLNGAGHADGQWPSYTVNNTGVMTATETKITSYHGALASYGEGAEATLIESEIDMAGIPGFTSHGIYTYSGGKVVVNGGTYANKATDQASSGASVINGAVEVNAGTFTGRIENYYGTPVLKGGTYSVQPNKNFLANGYKAVQDGEGWNVVKE